MTGILIFTAGRDDAFEDYQKSVQDGHSFSQLEPHLSDSDMSAISDYYEDGVAHFWGTSVDDKWQKVQQGDIALIYRDGKYIARAQVVHRAESLSLAEEIWNVEGNPWDEESPWRYLTFVTDVTEIHVGADEFNQLVDYEPSYRPQGFTRVADHRIERLEEDWESVETAIAELTETGEKKHKIDEDDTGEDPVEFVDELVSASKSGDGKEFEELVAEAFSRLGFEASWIEGGGDTDVEITKPIHAIVEAKSRSSTAGVAQLPATQIANHRDKRGAEVGIVVARHFPPSSVNVATENDLVTITVEHLVRLLELRNQYGIPPEVLAEILSEPGQVQDDRIDEVIEHIQSRVDSMETVLLVVRALAKADGSVQGSSAIRMILLGMGTGNTTPGEKEIQQAIELLSHPSLALVQSTENDYRLVTDAGNAIETLQSLDGVIEEAISENG